MELKKDNTMQALPDQGRSTVILDKVKYKDNINCMLSDKNNNNIQQGFKRSTTLALEQKKKKNSLLLILMISGAI